MSYPILHQIGLGSALDALERLAAKGAEKYPGNDWRERGTDEHLAHAACHLDYAENPEVLDDETGEPHAVHFALRALMALGCVIDD